MSVVQKGMSGGSFTFKVFASPSCARLSLSSKERTSACRLSHPAWMTIVSPSSPTEAVACPSFWV
ncbi:hypothetical protein AAH105_11060 [Parabacteroides distasonis]|uniref:hypothetical protein n=1 Tax=Parabacteroides distasonis TaxID=823 RepID=UPI0011C4877D|nr:hypothetical protein [Parabacteroides distasonis]